MIRFILIITTIIFVVSFTNNEAKSNNFKKIEIDTINDTIYTWIEKYKTGKIDTIFMNKKQIRSLKIDTINNNYIVYSDFSNRFGKLIGKSLVYLTDTNFINYSAKKIIKPVNLEIKKGMLKYLSNLLDTVYTDSAENFSFPHNFLKYSFINKPKWINFFVGTAYIINKDSLRFGYYSGKCCCDGMYYPRRYDTVRGDSYSLYTQTTNVAIGKYKWKIIAENFYGYKDTVYIITEVVPLR